MRSALGCSLFFARGAFLAGAARLAAVIVVGALVLPSVASARGLVVKLRGEGAHAVLECAGELVRKGRSFASATADRSDSLDRLRTRTGLGRFAPLFGEGASLAERRRQLRARFAARAARSRGASELPDLSHVYRVELPADRPAAEVASELRADPHVEYAFVDTVHALDDTPLPDDPFLHTSGSWGQQFEDLWALFRIRAPEAWALSQGEGVVVAVVDTGLDYEHPDIAANVFVHPGEDLNGNGVVDESDWNGVDDDGNGFIDDLRGFDFANSEDTDGDGRYDGPDDVSDSDPFDDVGHGTHVAGTIAAVADNGIGIAGVAPRARIMPLKGFPAEGPGEGSTLWRAVLYAAENGARVINNSWSCNPLCPENPLAEEVLALVHAMDVVVVTSAGNALTDVVYNSPENLRETITVASTGFDDRPSHTYTNFGWLVDLSAPGGGGSVDPKVLIDRRNILSLRSEINTTSDVLWVQDDYLRNSGTSMSAPHVAGVAALLRSQRPGLDADGVRRILRQSAQDLGPPGRDRDMGAGRLDAFAAVSHPGLPELFTSIAGPRPGATLSPEPGAVADVLGTASGRDLLEYVVDYGVGADPTEWVEIHRQDVPVEDGVLARWEISGLAPGAYVLRLRAKGRDGTTFYEFLPLSLERGVFRRISSEGRPAMAPAISGDWVVWQSRRRPDAPEEATADYNLFATHWRTGREVVIAATEEDEISASVHGRAVAWMHGGDFRGREIRACSLGRHEPSCRAVSASQGALANLPPAVAGGHAYWSDRSTGELDIRSCAIGKTGCKTAETGLAQDRRLRVRSDGRSLSWELPGFRFGLCELDRKTGACLDEIVTDPIFALSRPTYSDGLLAWVGFEPDGVGPLQICEVDAATGACDPVFVAGEVGDQTPTLSGNRLVWEAAVGDEEADVFFCEYDRLLGRCPVQRLTAHMSTQTGSGIDGDRIVWQDRRTGAESVQSAALPRLRAPRKRSVRAGEALAFVVQPVRTGPPGERAQLEIRARLPDGSPAETLGASFRALGKPGSGKGVFKWRPTPDQVGAQIVTFTATTHDGITTRSSTRIEVTPAPERKRRKLRAWSWLRLF